MRVRLDAELGRTIVGTLFASGLDALRTDIFEDFCEEHTWKVGNGPSKMGKTIYLKSEGVRITDTKQGFCIVYDGYWMSRESAGPLSEEFPISFVFSGSRLIGMEW